MSIHVTITRRPNPFWRSGEQIALEEWQRVVATDPEFRQPTAEEFAKADGFARPTDVIWKGHADGLAIWFVWDGGQIEVRSPDEVTLRKMAQVAAALRANLISDEGELFDAEGSSLGLRELPEDPADPKPSRLRQLAETGFERFILVLGAGMLLMLAYLMFRVWQQNQR